jgi:hypothetical protein
MDFRRDDRCPVVAGVYLAAWNLGFQASPSKGPISFAKGELPFLAEGE